MYIRHFLRSWLAGITAAAVILTSAPVSAQAQEMTAPEPAVTVSSGSVTLAKGETTTVQIDTVDTSDTELELKTLGHACSATLSESAKTDVLTITGTEEGTALCTILLKDSVTGATRASKTVSVTTTAPVNSYNQNIYMKLAATKVYVAAGATQNFYVRVTKSDGPFKLTAKLISGGSAVTLKEDPWEDGGTLKRYRLRGRTPGTASLSLTLQDTTSGTVLKTATVPIKIVKKGTIIPGVSSLSIKRTRYKDLSFSIAARPAGSRYSVSVNQAGIVKMSYVQKKWSKGTIRIRGRQKGKVNVTIKLTAANGKLISKTTIPITVKDSGVIDYAFRFYNSRQDFGYPDNYLIPLSEYQRMYGKNARASRLKKSVDESFGWGGNCFGMSSASGLIYRQNLSGGFRSGAWKAFDLALTNKSRYSGISLKSFIESMHISQYSETVVGYRNSRYSYGNNYKVNDRIVSLAKKGILTLIDLWGFEGHTVLAYKAVVSGNTAKVYVYDPNYTDTTRYITFTKTDEGHYEDFNYYINDDDKVYSIDYITYDEYAKSIWRNRGKLMPDSSYYTSLFTSSIRDLDLYSSNGQLAASVRDGELTNAASGIHLIRATDNIRKNGVMLYLPKDSYTVRNCSTAGETMNVTLTDTDRSAAVTTDADEATLIASDDSDSVGAEVIPGDGSSYEIELISTDTADPQQIIISGTGDDEPISASYADGSFDTNGEIVEGITEETTDMNTDPAAIHATDFAFHLLKASIGETGENILLSPYSMLSALAMAGAGADGETATQFEEVLCGGESLDTLAPVLGVAADTAETETVTEAATEADSADTSAKDAFHSASSIWLNTDSGASFLPSYLEDASRQFHAELFNESFDSKTLKQINTWTSDHTEGMIPELLDQLNPSLTAMLINASVFDSKWAVPYDPEALKTNRVFKAADGSSEPVTMMAGEEDTYIELNGAQGFTKPYEDDRCAFFALLPEPGTTPEDLISSLARNAFTNAYNKRQERTVHAMIPAFTGSYSAEMQDVLTGMGLTDAFSDQADFSKMSETGFRFDSVIHKTYISVDSNGTKAAAATAIGLKTTSAFDPDAEKPITIVLDRPFVYGILDTETGVPLFVGIQNHIN